MKQMFHIFWKDVRLHWIEILSTLSATALFVWLYPMSWGDSPTISVWPWVPGATVALLMVSWLVLITRVIHAESLVGERQFWITRPYLWRELLSAKVLFVAVFLYVPFFLAQCLLLREAGFHPLSHMAGLVFNLLLTTGIAVLPMACLAAVTSSFGKAVLAVLGLILFAGGVAYLSSILPTSSSTDVFSDEVSFVVAISVFIAVLFIQYSRRQTALAWMLLTALAVTFSIIGLAGPEEWAMKIAYPVSTVAAGPRLAFRQVSVAASTTTLRPADPREVAIVIPVAMSGIAPDAAVKMDDARVRFTSANGIRWVSYWQNASATWVTGQPNVGVNLKISRSFYDRMKETPMTVELSVALTLMKAGNVTHLSLPANSFELPGGSKCRISGMFGTNLSYLSCLSPMRQPQLMLIGTRFTTEDCSAAPPSNNGDPGITWVGTLDTQPAEFGLTPVWETPVWFRRVTSARSFQQQHLCPGSPLALVPYSMVSRTRQTIMSQPLTLKSLLAPRV
jgi:hypothetical protein